MKNNPIKRAVFLLLVAVTFYGCDLIGLLDSPNKSGGLDLSATPMENEEAELAAMWLSGKLIAPERLYEQIKGDLTLIREQWSDSIPATNIKFIPYYMASQFTVTFHEPYVQSILDGSYSSWDELNKQFRLDTIIAYGPFPSYSSFSLRFEGRLNPLKLIEYYEGLEGIKLIGPMGLAGGYPLCLMTKEEDGSYSYIFKDAWGDCPSGCIHGDFFYFKIKNNKAIFIDSYLDSDTTSIPGWVKSYRNLYYTDYLDWPSN